MIKSWWQKKSTSEKQIVAALAVLSLGVFCWLAVIKPIDTYTLKSISPTRKKIKKDIKWMQDREHPWFTRSSSAYAAHQNILREEAKREI